MSLLGLLLRLLDLAQLLLAVGTVATVAVLRAQLPAREALAVHFEAASFLAVAAALLRGGLLELGRDHHLAVDARAHVLGFNGLFAQK